MFRTDTPVTDPANQARIEGVLGTGGHAPPRGRHPQPVRPGRPGPDQPGGTIAYATIQLDDTSENIPVADAKKLLDTAKAASTTGFEVEAGGMVIGRAEAAAPGPAEAIGLVAAMIILLVAFGSVIAMGLPIVTALFGIGIGYAVISLLSRWWWCPRSGRSWPP